MRRGKASPKTSKNNSRSKNRSESKPVHVTQDGPSSYDLVRDISFPLNGTLGNNVVNIIAGLEVINDAVSSTTVPTFANRAITLANFDKVSSYTGIFDQYRIRMVEVTYIPHAQENTTAVNTNGLFTTVIDYDDATNLTAVADALSYNTAYSTSGTAIHKRCFIPHVADAIYSGAFTSFGNEECPWIDAASTGVLHYGLKSAWSVTSAICGYDTVIRAWIQFRNSR